MYAVRGAAKQKRSNSYSCANFRNRKRRGVTCTSHYIGQAVISELVLSYLQRAMLYVREHETDFIRKVTENGNTETRKLLESKRRELGKATARMNEIDTVFRKLYEDNALGRLPEQQFLSLTSGFENEKVELKKKLAELEREINTIEKRSSDAGKFVQIVKQYTDVQELTYEIAHEFVDKILIHNYDQEADTRKVEIFYSFVARSTAATNRREVFHSCVVEEKT